MRSSIILLLSVVWLAGCAKYQYKLTEPLQRVADVPHRSGLSIDAPPLSYGFLVLDDRLSVRIDNAADEPIEIDGHRSYVLDTAGQRHSLPNRTIPPHGHASLTIPPAPAHALHRYVSGRRHVKILRPPPAPIVLSGNHGRSWEWPRTGSFQLALAHRRGKRIVEDRFVLERQKT